MNEDDTHAALAHQESLEARRFYEEAQQALRDDAEAYCKWLDSLSREFEERDDAEWTCTGNRKIKIW